NADVATFALTAQIFPPRIIDDVDLGRRVEGIDSRLAIPAKDDGPHVARPRAVAAHSFEHGLHQLLAGVVDVNAIHLGGVEQTLHVLGRAEDRGSRGRRVATDPLEHRGAVVNHVRHHVNRHVIPGNKLAIVPDEFRFLDRHAYSFGWKRVKYVTRAESLLLGLQGKARTQPALQNIIAEPYHTVSTTFDCRMRASAVTSGMPSTIAVAAIKRSAGSLGNSSGKRTANAPISGVTGLRTTRATVSRTNDSTLPATTMRWWCASQAISHRVMVATAIPSPSCHELRAPVRALMRREVGLVKTI